MEYYSKSFSINEDCICIYSFKIHLGDFLSKHSDKYMKIGRKIAYYRKIKGLTQEQLAVKISASDSYISKIEAANTLQPFSLDILFDISEALEIDICEFLSDL